MNTKEAVFCIAWPDYQRKISNGYTRFQQHEEFVDMTLAADGHYVKVHQFIVALASPYLKEIIKSIPAKHPVIFLNNVSYSELCQILEYIYTGEVQISRHQLKDFMKSANALKLQGISNATTVQQSDGCECGRLLERGRLLAYRSHLMAPLREQSPSWHILGNGPNPGLERVVTLDEQAFYEEPMNDTAAETMAISSELERRMSIVNQEPMPDFDEIIEAGLVRVPSSSSNTHADTKIDSNNANFMSTETQQDNYEIAKTDIDDNIQIVDVNIVEDYRMMDQTNPSERIGKLVVQNPDQNQKPITPSKIIRSGTIDQIGKKTITVSSNNRKRKAGSNTALKRHETRQFTAESNPDVPSIVIQSNISGHSITVKNPSQLGSTQNGETMPSLVHSVGKSMPPLQSRPASIGASCLGKSMPQLTMSPDLAADSAPYGETKQTPQLIFTGADNVGHTSTQQPEPQIILQLPADAPPVITDGECPVEPSTSAQPVLSTNEFVDLINNDVQERKVLSDQLKGSTPQLYTISNQGSLQLILNRFIYYPHYKAYGGRKRRWRCIDYRRRHCQAYLDTDGEVINKRVNTHTHAFHDEKILLKLEKKLVFSTITSATAGARKASLGGDTESSENIE